MFYILGNRKIIVTGSAKPVLLPMTGSSLFRHKHINTLIHYHFTLPKLGSIEWSAGSFFLAHWQSIRAILVLDGALVSK